MPEVRCPTCRRRGPWLELPTAPFCSPRCRLIDLGKWLNEEYRVAADGEPVDEDETPPHAPRAEDDDHPPPPRPRSRLPG